MNRNIPGFFTRSFLVFFLLLHPALLSYPQQNISFMLKELTILYPAGICDLISENPEGQESSFWGKILML